MRQWLVLLALLNLSLPWQNFLNMYMLIFNQSLKDLSNTSLDEIG
jgi:hypothetical protein